MDICKYYQISYNIDKIIKTIDLLLHCRFKFYKLQLQNSSKDPATAGWTSANLTTRVRHESSRQNAPEEGFLYMILKQPCK